jgi:predicted ATPase
VILKTVYVRFYKSFNFDYLRKHHQDAKPLPWEMIGSMWYPFARIPIDPAITTVVGANESGKSHLLSAIEKGLSGEGIEREDFCRYSQFFTVEQGKMRWPDFGFEFCGLTDEDARVVKSACGLTEQRRIESFHLFRFNNERLIVYVGEQACDVVEAKIPELAKVLPYVFRIDAKVALPATVPIRHLIDQAEGGEADQFERLGRKQRFSLLSALAGFTSFFQNQQTVTSNAAQIAGSFAPFVAASQPAEEREREQRDAEYALAHDLICKVARTDPAALTDLYEAIRDGRDGHALGIVQRINAALAKALNFPRWWVQDRDFKLVVSAREYDLVFTIRDKTETDYSFGERSSGLRYFLSYYVQYLAHEQQEHRHEILLMDEPDAYLSSQAQQDLLRIFTAFSSGDEGRQPVQVVYVTHSPFLIDKNHADRIRVLEKGSGDEGTRVVRNASRNHYEPLRSAFGAFVGETVFIGNCNLVVEGPADQILLAGAATVLQAKGASDFETLDLNRVTIVPAGSASHVPYMVFLARGRDVEQPAVVVLLDSDEAGNDARKALKKGPPRGKSLIDERYVIQVAEVHKELGLVPSGVQQIVELEDLIPFDICLAAVNRYNREFGVADENGPVVQADDVRKQITEGKSIFDALNAVLSAQPFCAHLDKIGFARAVCEVAAEMAKRDPLGEVFRLYDRSMRILFRRLTAAQRQAFKVMGMDRVSKRVERAKSSFFSDYPNHARREQALLMVEDIERSLDDGPESDLARVALKRVRRDFTLDDEVGKPVDNYEDFKRAMETVRYAGVLKQSDAVEAYPPNAAEMASQIMEQTGLGSAVPGAEVVHKEQANPA